MKTLEKTGLVLMLLFCVGIVPLFAQGPPGGGPGGFDPDEMIKREKQNVFKSITDLNDDQKLLLDGIYDEFSLSFKELREEMMQTRDFQAMRPKMQALQTEKDGLVKDVLNDDQYLIYQGIIEQRRAQRGSRPPGGAQGENGQQGAGQPGTDSNPPIEPPQ